MATTRYQRSLALACVLLAPGAQAQGGPAPAEARALAKQSYIFTYPPVMMYRTMYLQAISEETGVGFGNWLHLGMSSPEDTDIVTPNNDMPYSYAWVDLRAEPWVLTMPPIGNDRFYTSQWDDLWGYVLDNPGSVNHGNEGVSVLLAPPGWGGALPEGIARAVQGETQFLGTLTRTQVIGGAADMQNVSRIQNSYLMQPLSAFLGTGAPPAAPGVDWMPWGDGDEKTLGYWDHVARLLPFVEPDEEDEAAYETLAALGIVRGEPFASAGLDTAMQKALQGGIDDARDQLEDWGNSSDISVYLTVQADATGALLDGGKTAYTLTFEDGELPPVK